MANAKAVPITYTESATVSGTLTNGSTVTPFTNELLTLTGTGDTTKIITVNRTFGLFNNPLTVSFTLSGGITGSGTFTDAFVALVRQANTVAAFDDGPLGGDLIETNNAAFATYALATSIGPITGLAGINASFSFPTTGGTLKITSVTPDSLGNTNSTFTAVVTPVVTPLPATLPLFAGGLGALGLLHWRRKRKAQSVGED